MDWNRITDINKLIQKVCSYKLSMRERHKIHYYELHIDEAEVVNLSNQIRSGIFSILLL